MNGKLLTHQQLFNMSNSKIPHQWTKSDGKPTICLVCGVELFNGLLWKNREFLLHNTGCIKIEVKQLTEITESSKELIERQKLKERKTIVNQTKDSIMYRERLKQMNIGDTFLYSKKEYPKIFNQQRNLKPEYIYKNHHLSSEELKCERIK